MIIFEGSGQNLPEFLKCQKKETESWLESPGAVLFRDFHIDGGVEIDDLARKLDYTPFNTYIPGIWSWDL